MSHERDSRGIDSILDLRAITYDEIVFYMAIAALAMRRLEIFITCSFLSTWDVVLSALVLKWMIGSHRIVERESSLL